MALLKIPHNTTFNFVQFRFVTFVISGLLCLLTASSLTLNGLNYGIDFKGGVLVEMRLPHPPNFAEIRSKVSPLVQGDISLQEFGSERDILMRIEHQGDKSESQASDQESSNEHVIAKIKKALDPSIEYRRIETIGPKVGAELVKNGFLALVLSLLAMLAYVWFRFEWQFSVCAIFALLHDCVGVLALFALFRYEFNETAIVALLITVSYSINDTVVVFDRIRENRQKHAGMALRPLINLSLNETLSRTLLTSTTTLLALLTLYFLGGAVIESFSLPIIVGMAVGTYSSICLAAPLLIYLPQSRTQQSQST